MLGIKKIRKTLSVLTGVALLCVASISAAAATGVVRADINVRGKVTVNDQFAVSNSTVVTGSTVTTGSESSAVIGIGSNGRIELMPNTTVILNYGNSSIDAFLTAGGIRVADAAGIGTTITTTDAVISADPGKANTFSVNSSKGTSGSLDVGKLTVVKASGKVNFTVGNGKVVSLRNGESVTQDDDDDDDDDHWFIWALVLGGATGAVIAAVRSLNNDPQGFSTTVVVASPT